MKNQYRSRVCLALSLALLGGLSLTACGGEGDSGGAEVKADAGAQDGGIKHVGGGDAVALDAESAGQDAASVAGDAGGSGDAASVSDSASVDDSGQADSSAATAPNTSFDTAIVLKNGVDVSANLLPTGASHYYKFEGKKGEAVLIGLTAQEVPFNDKTIDTVLTLYDKNKKKIGENDDPLPRVTNDSRLLTILPSSGTFYVVVQECWTWVEKNAPGASCAEPKNKENVTYSLLLQTIDSSQSNINDDQEKGNTKDDATTVGYGKSQSGDYVMTLIYGMFSDENDVDVFAFTPPADSKIGESRPISSFDFYPSGPDGNGSTASPGSVWLASAATPSVAIAKLDVSKGGGLSTPLPLGKPSLLFVPHSGAQAGANDFYFINHRVTGDNPLETEDKTNDKVETPEVLKAGEGATGEGISYFVAGDLLDQAKDVDHFSFAIPTGAAKVTVACGAQSSGSGLRELSAALLLADGSSTSAVGLESPQKSAVIKDFAVPTGSKKLILKVSAAKQASDVSGTYYRCGVHVL